MHSDYKHEGSVDYGPGHTQWYVDDEGEIMVAKWNDKAWRSRTFVFLEEIIGKNTHRNSIITLLNDAYREGMKDQQLIVKQALGIDK